jgi:hypothetical protein
MVDKATIEIDWDNKIVGVSNQPLDFVMAADKTIKTSYAQIVAMLASKYAHDLIQLSPEELKEKHIQMLSGL